MVLLRGAQSDPRLCEAPQMLEEFTVDNFKSLINVTFRPHEWSLLLGMNNAGKTNLCQALMFLAATARYTLSESADEVLAGRADALTNFYFDKPTSDFAIRASVPLDGENLSFHYNLSIAVGQAGGPSASLEVQAESLRVNGGGFNDVLLLENYRGRARLLHEGGKDHVQTTAPRDATMLSHLYDEQANAAAMRFRFYLMSWQYHALSVAAMRGFEHWPNVTGLFADGSNLASAIYQLKMGNGREYRGLLERLRVVEPFVDEIDFLEASAKKVFMSFQLKKDRKGRKGRSLPADVASSGTLRYLALLYVLVALPQLGASSLRIIEEPENGIYVGYLKHLLESAAGVDPPQQLIFTSHSPYFIDLFDNRLDSIFVLKGGKQHSSLTQPNPNLVKKRLETFPLGEQHFREMLG
jgi:predicted ATPase